MPDSLLLLSDLHIFLLNHKEYLFSYHFTQLSPNHPLVRKSYVRGEVKTSTSLSESVYEYQDVDHHDLDEDERGSTT